MTHKQKYRKLGWRTEKILAEHDDENFKKGEWLGFWRMVAPDGIRREGWYGDDGKAYWRYNCFDGRDEGYAVLAEIEKNGEIL